MKNQPLASVIIPTYNRQDTIVGSVESALAQTYGNLEVIVVDDGSTDGTVRTLDRFGGRIRVIRQRNAGPSAARNRGVAESNGEIVAFLDSDDHWLPEKIARQVALMERGGPEMCCCVCNATVKGEDGAAIGETFDFAGIRPPFVEGEWSNPQELLATRFLLFNQVVAVRREAFDRVGGFDETMRLLEDYELSLRLSSAGAWGVIRDPLVTKYNDTFGLGVACMSDAEQHASVRASVLAGIGTNGARPRIAGEERHCKAAGRCGTREAVARPDEGGQDRPEHLRQGAGKPAENPQGPPSPTAVVASFRGQGDLRENRNFTLLQTS